MMASGVHQAVDGNFELQHRNNNRNSVSVHSTPVRPVVYLIGGHMDGKDAISESKTCTAEGVAEAPVGYVIPKPFVVTFIAFTSVVLVTMFVLITLVINGGIACNCNCPGITAETQKQGTRWLFHSKMITDYCF